MKKTSLIALGLVFLFCVHITSAFAQTPLNDIIDNLLDVKYKFGGATEKGLDCSGFTMYVFDQLNIDLPHSSRSQAALGKYVSKDDLRPGDLVFFNTGGSGISHVGIYIGNGQFAHSATNEGVTKDKLSESYYIKRYVTARRVLSDEAFKAANSDK